MTGVLLGRTLALLTVTSVTVAAVSYGLDADHVLDEVALTRARAAAAALEERAAALWSDQADQ